MQAVTFSIDNSVTTDMSGRHRKELSISFENPVRKRLKPGKYCIQFS